MNYLGEYTPGKTVRCRFNTHKADGTPITLAGTPAVSVYKGSTTESTTGVTLTVDYDSRTGLHDVVIDTSADGTFYAAGNDFDLILTAGTVDSISVVGSKVGMFSLSNRAFLRPTTADRTLDVSAGGEAGLDWANVGTPGATVVLSATTVSTLTTYTGNTPQTGDSFARIGALGAGLTALAQASTALSTAQWTNARATALDNLDVTVSSRLATAGYTSPPSAATVANLVWDTVLASHATAGSTGAALSSASSAGDPWSTALPGSYAAGTAGNIVGNRLDAAVSTRSTLAFGTLLSAPRSVDGIADGSLTVNDALWCAIVAAAGKESISGTTYTVKTPSTGTVLRTFTLDSATAPASRT